jgi:hypothetical protein
MKTKDVHRIFKAFRDSQYVSYLAFNRFWFPLLLVAYLFALVLPVWPIQFLSVFILPFTVAENTWSFLFLVHRTEVSCDLLITVTHNQCHGTGNGMTHDSQPMRLCHFSKSIPVYSVLIINFYWYKRFGMYDNNLDDVAENY